MTQGFPRNLLFAPANRPTLVDSAFRSAAEAIVFDLEDLTFGAADVRADGRAVDTATIKRVRQSLEWSHT